MSGGIVGWATAQGCPPLGHRCQPNADALRAGPVRAARCASIHGSRAAWPVQGGPARGQMHGARPQSEASCSLVDGDGDTLPAPQRAALDGGDAGAADTPDARGQSAHGGSPSERRPLSGPQTAARCALFAAEEPDAEARHRWVHGGVSSALDGGLSLDV